MWLGHLILLGLKLRCQQKCRLKPGLLGLLECRKVDDCPWIHMEGP